MRLASNRLKDLIRFYYTELAAIYEPGEIQALLSLAAEHYIGYTRQDLLTRTEDHLNQSDLLKLYDCAKALAKNIPLQYILKEAWFYDLKFYVDTPVLIPRPETEELVDLILKENQTAGSFFDIGTGSGCIPVSLKKHVPGSKVSACDISPEALKIAGKNAEVQGTEVLFFAMDVLNKNSFAGKLEGPYDVIVSNPPYITLSEKTSMAPHVAGQEPDLALFVEGADPILFYKKIIDLCADFLAKGGRLYFELNPLTAHEVLDYANGSRLFEGTELVKDLSGKERFLKAVRT